MDKILDDYHAHIKEVTTSQVVDRYGFTRLQLAKWECAKYLHTRTDAYGTIFWPREELDQIHNDPDAFETDLVSDAEASRMLECYPSFLDQLEVILDPEYALGIRLWDKTAIESLIHIHEVDE
jgi:hypothetical protein